MATKIYTRTGDKGTTSLIGGTKVPKSHLRIEAYGTVDELNSHLGLCRDLVPDETIRAILLEAQDRLFTIGSSLACDPGKEPKLKIPDLNEEDILLPGGHPQVSQLHIARCVCRRAERCTVKLELESLELDPLILKYLNRLSDWLFIAARYVSHERNATEIPWKPRTTNNTL